MTLFLAATLLATPAEAAADSDTIVYDGSTSCDEIFPGLEICLTYDGVSHFTSTGRGRYISVFEGDRTIEVISHGITVLSLVNVDTHSVFHYTFDPTLPFSEALETFVNHYDTCVTTDGGATYFHYDYHIASGELRYDSSEAVDSCD